MPRPNPPLQDQNNVFYESNPNPEVQQNNYRPIMAAPTQPEPQEPVYTNPMVQPTPNNNDNQAYAQEVYNYNYNYQQPTPGNTYYTPPQDTVNNNLFSVSPQVQPTVNKDTPAPTKAPTPLQKLTDWLATKWWIVLVLALGIVLITVGAFAYLRQTPTYAPTDFTNVRARIEAPSTSPSGSPGRWNVVVQNLEPTTIHNIEVKLEFNRTFRYSRSINPDPADPKGNLYTFPSLAAPGQGTSELIIQFEGVLTGNIDEETAMSGEISYTPQPLLNNPNGRRTIPINAAKTRITSPEIKVSLTSSEQSVQNGGEVEIRVDFENLSERELTDLRIRMNYPDQGNFTYTSSELTVTNAEPKTKPDDGNNTWFLSSLPRLRQQNLRIRGNLFGAEGVRQSFSVEIGIKGNNNEYQTLAIDSGDLTVTSQPLVISTRVEGKDATKNFAPGETLNIIIDYQNKSTTTLRNVEIFGFIDDPASVLDYSTISFVGGDQGNQSNRVIQWRGAGTPQLVNLTPQVRGQLRYSIRVKEGGQFIQSSLNQNSYTLRPKVQAKASNLQQIEFAGDLYKAKGDLQLEQTIQLLNDRSTRQNQRVYRVTWTLRTRQNKVNDILVQTRSPLPPTAWNPASVTPQNSVDKLNYDPLTGNITWRPGSLDSYTGLSSPVATVTFELTTENNERELFTASRVTGVDDFTGEKYERTGPVGNAAG